MTLTSRHADHFPPRPLSGLGAAVAGIPCESPHIVVANLLSIRPVEMTGWRETLRCRYFV